MSFSNLVLDDVTGPIHISIGPKTQRNDNARPTPVDAERQHGVGSNLNLEVATNERAILSP
jgi:hypothetical protein